MDVVQQQCFVPFRAFQFNNKKRRDVLENMIRSLYSSVQQHELLTCAIENICIAHIFIKQNTEQLEQSPYSTIKQVSQNLDNLQTGRINQFLAATSSPTHKFDCNRINILCFCPDLTRVTVQLTNYRNHHNNLLSTTTISCQPIIYNNQQHVFHFSTNLKPFPRRY